MPCRSRVGTLRWVLAACAVALATACAPTMEEVVAKHRAAVESVFAQIRALDDAIAVTPPLDKDGVDIAPGSVVLDGVDSNALFVVGTDVAAPEHSDSTATGATRAATVQGCGEALRGEFHGVPKGAELYLSECERAKYLFVLRSQSEDAAQMVGVDSYTAGHYTGDVLLFRLADGKLLGGFRIDAQSNGSVMAHTDAQGNAIDAATRLDSDLSANTFVEVEEKLKKFVPGAVK